MPRNISFSLTTPQFQAGTKTVTRRLGWDKVKAGDVLCAVEKGQGLKKGEKVKKLGMIRVIDARRELLRRMTDDLDYGFAECAKEGFPAPHPNMWPSVFVEFFCAANRPCQPDWRITRIEFEKLEPGDGMEGK